MYIKEEFYTHIYWFAFGNANINFFKVHIPFCQLDSLIWIWYVVKSQDNNHIINRDYMQKVIIEKYVLY